MGQWPVVEFAFSPPRSQLDVDADAIMAAVPRSATNKRIFIEIPCKQVAARLSVDEVLARAGVTLRVDNPYDDVPWHDYFRVVVVVAGELCGSQIGEGLREIGRTFYPSLAGTPVGQMLVGRHLGAVVRQAAENWMLFNTVGSVRAEYLFERNFRFVFEGYPLVLTETMAVGVFEGMFNYFHMPVQLGLANLSPMSSVLDVRW